MEQWVQLIVAAVSLLRVLMELPDMLCRWKKRYRKQKQRRNKKDSA